MTMEQLELPILSDNPQPSALAMCVLALRVIATMPIPEQDNMLSAAMRHTALHALEHLKDGTIVNGVSQLCQEPKQH